MSKQITEPLIFGVGGIASLAEFLTGMGGWIALATIGATIFASACVELLRSADAHRKAKSVIAMGLFGISVLLFVLATLWLNRVTALQLQEAIAKIQGLQLDEVFYKSAPSDADFIVRKQRIEKTKGGVISIAGPQRNDMYALTISNMTQGAGDTYIAELAMSGVVGGNRIGGPAGKLIIRTGEKAEPVSVAVRYIFDVFVESVDVDYALVSVSRRSIKPKHLTLMIFESIIPPGSVNIGGIPEPAAIFSCK